MIESSSELSGGSSSELAGRSSGEPSAESSAESSGELQPLAVSSATVTLWGLACWVVALVATLVVPSLHEGERHWWPWTCVAAIVIGSLGYTYVRRGRGNAASAT
ncbi:DUF2530 domain-containing protein [Pedococcus sp. 2YAF34]|uniref:DUF2530 domain-containing protein n=1 Tax=Pedococcus sp. 2YAF34 TaxID=3233032 RepID=UPI003F9D6825